MQNKSIIGNTFGALLLIISCIALQHGTTILSQLIKEDIEFRTIDNYTTSGSLDKLRNGFYYISTGRTLDKTEIFTDTELLASSGGISEELSTLTLGAAFRISDLAHPKKITIKHSPREAWRAKFYSPPTIVSLRLGLLIHGANAFIQNSLGPLFSLILLFSALISAKTLKLFNQKILALIIMASVYFVYSVFLSGVPDLFYFGGLNTVGQAVLRCGLSCALVYLYGTYSRQQPLLLWSHLGFALLNVSTFVLNPSGIITAYKVSYLFYCASAVIMTAKLVKYNNVQDPRIANALLQLGLAWSFLSGITTFLYLLIGPSYFTVVSPAFIVVAAVMNIYVFYRTVTNTLIEREVLKFDLVASRKLMTIASQVAHDIRSPVTALSVILANEPGISGEAKEVSISSLQRIKDVSDELLDEYRLSKRINLGNSDYKTQVAPIDIQELAFKSFEEKKYEFRKNSDLKFQFLEGSDSADYIGFADKIALQRILSNILNNAVEASDYRGEITMRISSAPSTLTIEIRDKGKGITPEVLRNLKSGISTSTKTDGHGLGMSFAHTCIQSWGGELTIELSPQTGTAISINLRKQ